MGPSVCVSILQHKGHHHIHLIAGDLAVNDGYLMLFHPSARHIAQSFGGPFYAFFNGVLKAFVRGRRKFGHAGYGHRIVFLWFLRAHACARLIAVA